MAILCCLEFNQRSPFLYTICALSRLTRIEMSGKT